MNLEKSKWGYPERFMDKVSPEPNSGCWLWVGYTNPKGYGQFWHKGTMVKAHRFAVEALDSTLHVRHLCHNTSCVNPDHLALGTPVDNAQDAIKAGRYRRGKGHPQAKLSHDDVLAIRACSYGELKPLVKTLPISYRYAKHVKAGRKWAHVQDKS